MYIKFKASLSPSLSVRRPDCDACEQTNVEGMVYKHSNNLKINRINELEAQDLYKITTLIIKYPFH